MASNVNVMKKDMVTMMNNTGFKIDSNFDFGLRVTENVTINGKIINRSDLAASIRREFRPYNVRDLKMLDNNYFIPDQKSNDDLISAYLDNDYVYTSEQFDCDKFALVLKTFWVLSTQHQNLGGGVANGLLTFSWSKDRRGIFRDNSAHALNCLSVSNGNKVNHKIIEPQNGKVYDIQDYLGNFEGVRINFLMF